MIDPMIARLAGCLAVAGLLMTMLSAAAAPSEAHEKAPTQLASQFTRP